MLKRFDAFWDRWIWLFWLAVLAIQLAPPSAAAPWVALPALFLGLRAHERFGSSLYARGTRLRVACGQHIRDRWWKLRRETEPREFSLNEAPQEHQGEKA